MRIRVRIKSASLSRVRQGNNGKTYGNQQAALEIAGSDFAKPFVVNVQEGREYRPGLYDIEGDCFATNNFGELTLGRLSLIEAEAEEYLFDGEEAEA